MYPVYFIKKNEQSETTLRNSAVRYSKFCGSLFGLVKFHMRVHGYAVLIMVLFYFILRLRVLVATFLG
jgi:hypothetical protein